MGIIDFLVIGLLIGQFTPQGQRFLATDAGSAAFVGIAALAVFSMLPGALLGHPMSIALIGVWGYYAYTRFDSALRWARSAARRITRR